MSGTYAKGTTVDVSSSRNEIERTLQRFGASAFGYMWDDTRAVIQFQAHGRQVRFVLPLPEYSDFTHTPSTRQRRSKTGQQKAYDDGVKRRWRALGLAIKAKLEVVSSEISSFESEFLAHIILPDGNVVGNWLAPQLEVTYTTGQMPSGLPGLPPPRD